MAETRQDKIAFEPQTLDLAALGRRWSPTARPDSPLNVSEVIEGLPWWAARGLLYLIASAVFAAVVWAGLSRIDVVVEARGALLPEGYVRPVQTQSGGAVQQVFVREGDAVLRGQPLVQLDGAQLRTRLTKLREELATSRDQLRQTLALQGPTVATLEHQNRLARLESEAGSVEITLRQTTITAPTDGILTTLEAASAGAVLQPGQTVATIAPAGTRLVIEAHVANKDMSSLEPGLNARLKFDAFPWQDYGVVVGRVIAVAPDATANKGQGSFYKVTILPELKPGQKMKVRPGLTATTEIVTERRTVLSFLLEPFRKLSANAK